MTSPTKLIASYQRSHWVIVQQTDGLTHADSLLQLPFRGNCMNWVLGHILVYRDRALELLGEDGVLSASEVARYERGAEPITQASHAVKLDRLLHALDQSQERIIAALNRTTPEALALAAGEDKERTVGDRLDFSHWHETYHVGQLEILRQLAGKDDAVI